ncbi:MAG: SMC family ATPase, partial [Actinobacteria bacterium]|nr:SMC family ATPase [Actinomycetota bacterium]MBW3650939.1 SMC family ATPase [Actinomycetota bacterium]
MRITRVYLRNYRVYEDELDLPVPAGLVGVYGVNGSGKSSLLESLLWTLWGRTRTRVEDVRTTGINADCVTEVEFEHEGHLYTVRRTISGINSTVRASAEADGLQVASGVRDVKQYVHSVLGMDDAAFRASVFAEQKQLASFSRQKPAERRELVLRLLGITPLDAARDHARKDARAARDDVERVRVLLPDLDQLRPASELAAATAERLAAEAASEATAAATAQRSRDVAEAKAAALEELRHEHDALVAEGKAVRAEIDQGNQRVELLESELVRLAEAESTLDQVRAAAEGADELDEQLRLVRAVVEATVALERLVEAPPAEAPDEEAVEAARTAADQLRGRLDTVTGEVRAAEATLDRARVQLARSSELSADQDCPVCGQELGQAFATVQSHRRVELEEAQSRLDDLVRQRDGLLVGAQQAAGELQHRLATCRAAREAWEAAERLRERRLAAVQAREAAVARLGREATGGEADRLAQALAEKRQAATTFHRLAGLLERKPVAQARLVDERERLAAAVSRRAMLLEKVAALGFDAGALEAARAAREDARRRSEAAARAAEEARLAAERARVTAEAEAQRLADAERQHQALADRTEDARHLGRLAELLNAFRTSVVATVGPRLSAQAADLFGELTDHEYDLLKVDPETYEIQIVDQGRAFGMERFSGSETDLANLA